MFDACYLSQIMELLSHVSGVCEPLDSELCQDKNDINFEESEPFSCPAAEKDGKLNFHISTLQYKSL